MAKASNGYSDTGTVVRDVTCNYCQQPFKLRVSPGCSTAKRKYCSMECRKVGTLLSMAKTVMARHLVA